MCKKLTYLTSFILVLVAFPPVIHAQVENLSLNPSFEEDEVILDDPDWFQWATWGYESGLNSTVEIDETESVDGTRSLRIEPTGNTDWYFIVLNLPISVDINKDYTVSFWAKAEAPRPLTVQMKAEDNSINAWGATTFDLTTEWAEYHYSSEVLIDTIKIEILCSSSEVLFWLDFFLVYEGQYVAGIEPSGVSGRFKPSNAYPADEAVDVPRDVVLRWTPPSFAATHDVYFGTVFDDVNDASRTNPLDILVSQSQDANTYEPHSLLEYNQTYYWRIDEVNDSPDDDIYKGNVWSFTAELFAYLISGQNITAMASSSEQGRGPENVISGSGLDESGLLHNKLAEGNMWLSNRDGEQPTWIEFEFDKVYELHQMWVWNSNESLEPAIGVGIRDVTIEYSIDGNDYTTLGATHEFTQAPGADDYAHNTTIELDGIAAKFIRFTANSNWGGILNQFGLSEVRFLFLPVHVKEPNPASGATDVALEPILSWIAGREAAEHNVYFSDNEQAVIDSTADITTVTENSYGPLDLDLGKTYYWRVDEVNNAETPGIWQGDIWNFTTFEYFVIDDFEDYNDYEPDRIFDTWIDGWGVATNGSTIGYESPEFDAGEHFVETNIVNSGSQAMPYFYDNSVGNSEATMTLDSRRNWSEKGIGTLTLWYRGNPAGFVEDPAGTYTISASGADIWGTADEFRYIFKRLSGPGSIVAKVESVEDTDPWAKAGVMTRQSLDAGSKFAAVYITPGNGCSFQGRLTIAGEATADTDVATTEQTAITAPYWVRIERDTSNNFNGYYSNDSTNWIPMSWNPQSTAMPSDVYIGLAVTSHNSGATCTAVFSNVQTTGTVSPQIWTQEAIGVDMPSNNAELIYVVLDGSAVVYNDNPNATQTDEWTQWNIDLQEFADQGVELTNVDTIGIGFGDRDNPQPGGLGVVYFDDIRLYSLPPSELIEP